MKKIKFFSLIILQLAVLQFVAGQNLKPLEDENGRLPGMQPTVPAHDKPEKRNVDVYDGSDQDIAGNNEQGISEDIFYPDDIITDVDVLPKNHVSNKEILQKIETMEAEIQALRLHNEQLRQENQTIRRGMSNCCAANASKMRVTNSFLLQNAPNPFDESTQIQFFVPEDVQTAKLEVRDIKGKLLDSFDISQGGLGQITVKGAAFAQGSYVYTLSIDGEIIDSKVMILTK